MKIQNASLVLLLLILVLVSCHSKDGSNGDIRVGPVDAPRLTGKVKGESADLFWSDIPSASYYEVYRHTEDKLTDATKLANNFISYTDLEISTNVEISSGTTYYYWVRACSSGGCSGFSKPLKLVAPFLAPKLTGKVKRESADLFWSDIPGASYYEVYRHTQDQPHDATIISSLLSSEGTTHTDIKIPLSVKRYYWIKACSNVVCSDFSNASALIRKPALNDTGISWDGSYESNKDQTCAKSNTIQDCHFGRDVTHNDHSNGHAGFDFTKLDADGNELTIQNVKWSDFGYESDGTRWSCVRDNVTGLVWEVKTSDGESPSGSNPTVSVNNIHHKDNLYRWGGVTAIGHDHNEREGNYSDDWDFLVNGSNNDKLCGYDDWRSPTTEELQSIVDYSRIRPSIDRSYFPNTPVDGTFWASSPDSSRSEYAWIVYFNFGSTHSYYRNYTRRLRLVRGGR